MLLVLIFYITVFLNLIHSLPTGNAIGDISPLVPYILGPQSIFSVAQIYYQDPSRYVTLLSSDAFKYFLSQHPQAGTVTYPATNAYCTVFPTCPIWTPTGDVSIVNGDPIQVSQTVDCTGSSSGCTVNADPTLTSVTINWRNPGNIPTPFVDINFNENGGDFTWETSMTFKPSETITCGSSGGVICVLYIPTYVSAEFTCSIQGYFYNPTQNGDQYQDFSIFTCPAATPGIIQAPNVNGGLYSCGYSYDQCQPV